MFIFDLLPVNLHTVGGTAVASTDGLSGGSLRRNVTAPQGSARSPTTSTSPQSTIALSPSPDRHSGTLNYDDITGNITQINVSVICEL